MTDNAFYVGSKVYFTIEGEIRSYSDSLSYLMNQGYTKRESTAYLDNLIENAK